MKVSSYQAVQVELFIISKYPAVNTEVTGTEVTINVSGVTSGHSGVDIIYQRANANVVLGRLLFELSKQYNYNIRTISGGEKDNSIAPRSEAVIVVEDGDTAGVVEMLNKYAQLIINEYSVTDKDMSIKVSQGSKFLSRQWITVLLIRLYLHLHIFRMVLLN